MGGNTQSINLRLLVVTFVILLVSSLALSYLVAQLFQRYMAPEIERKAVIVGDTLRNEFLRANELGIPFTKLRAADRLLADAQQDQTDIKYLVVTDRAGQLLYHSGDIDQALRDALAAIAREQKPAPAATALKAETRAILDGRFYNTTLAISGAGGVVGYLHVGSDAQLVDKALYENLVDVITMLFVTLLVVYELLLCLIGANIADPIRWANRAMAAVKRNDFTVGVGAGPPDEIGRFIGRLDDTIGEVNRRLNAVAQRARELAPRARDKAVRAVIDRAEALAQRYRFATAPSHGLVTERGLRFIRAALFLFIFAESLSLSFFPIFTRAIYEPIPGLATTLAIGLPISLFWLFVALVQPFAGRWSQSFGYRNVFVGGALVTAFGLLMTAFVADYWQLIGWRAVTALGYGAVFLVCQGFIMDHMPRERGTEGAATFTSAFFSATICGTTIGAILADQIGYRVVFLASCGLALIAAGFVWFFLKDLRGDRGSAALVSSVTWRWRDLGVVLGNHRFLVLVFFCAVPARLLNGAFLLYLGPLYLNLLENTKAEVGRIMVIYAVIMALTTLVWARIADRRQSQLSFVIVGAFLSGVAMLGALIWGDTIGVIVSITVMGIAQAVGMPSQVSLVPVISARECDRLGRATVIGLFRVFERIGSIVGPVAAAILVGLFGYPWTMAAIGMFVVAASAVLCGVFLLGGLGDTSRVREAGE